MNIKFIYPMLLIFYIFIISFNLLKLPLYLDEGLYIFWSYLFSTDPSHAYIGMQDGKTPLFMWLTAWVNPLFNNFLFTGRFISVIASAISLICFSVIAFKILGRKSLYFALFLFLITPFNILISRLAFVDSLLIAFSSLSILGIYLLRESIIKKQILLSLGIAILAGVVLGLAFLTKTTAKIFLAAEMFILVFWLFRFLKEKNIKAAGILVLSGLIIAGLYFEIAGYLKFGALKHWDMIANKETVLVFSPPEIYRKFILERDYSTHLKNIPISLEYLIKYFGPILVFFAAGVVWIFKQKKHYWIPAILLILISGVFLSAKVPASRYFAIIIPEVLIISTFGLFWIWHSNLKYTKNIAIIILIISSLLSLKMILDPANAYYASDDQANFVDYNLNALGMTESVEYLESRKENAAVGVTGIWGIAEGANVAFKEKGIEVYTVGKLINSHIKKEELCEEDFKQLEGKCWKIDFGDLIKSEKPEKYIYLITEELSMTSLKQIMNFEVVKEFVRPRTNLNVYLIKLN